jgi:hypothetical protein
MESIGVEEVIRFIRLSASLKREIEHHRQPGVAEPLKVIFLTTFLPMSEVFWHLRWGSQRRVWIRVGMLSSGTSGTMTKMSTSK